MARNHIDKRLKSFLKQIFCVVGHNSPYELEDFTAVLLDAAEHEDFTNNTTVRLGGPTGETVFARLKEADSDRISQAFLNELASMLGVIKRLLRNRKVALAFDTTDEPYYGKLEGFWIHPHGPVRGSTGCFKFISLSIVDREHKFVLGSLPVRRGADTVKLVKELICTAIRLVRPEVFLFDRGFDSYELVDELQKLGMKYNILWKKTAWTTKRFKKMKRGQISEVTFMRKYSKNKSTFKVKIRFVLIKKYKRYGKGKAYDWVFGTNTRYKFPHYYVDKYRKRWGIETAFRVLDNVNIKTTTKNEVIRYFINAFCCLLYNLWKVNNLLGTFSSLKNFVYKATAELKLSLRTQAVTKPPDTAAVPHVTSVCTVSV